MPFSVTVTHKTDGCFHEIKKILINKKIMVSCLVKHPPMTELKLALKWLGLTAKGKDVLMKPQLTQTDILGGKKKYTHMQGCVHWAAT